MGATPVYALPYPELADPADAHKGFMDLANATEAALLAAALVPIGALVDWPYASGSIPSWALLPYGQTISRTTYASLHAIVQAAGYPHGAGDGSSTFALPDLRGRVLAGKDDMGGAAAGRITAAISGTAGTVLGAVVGAEGVTITTAQLPAHNHGVTGAPSLAGGITPGPAGIGIAGAYTGISTNQDAGHQHVAAAGQFFTTGAGPGGGLHSQFNTIPGGNISLYTSTPTGLEEPRINRVDPGHTHGVYDGPHGHSHTFSVGPGSLGTANTGGGSAHANTQPTLIVNKFMRVK